MDGDGIMGNIIDCVETAIENITNINNGCHCIISDDVANTIGNAYMIGPDCSDMSELEDHISMWNGGCVEISTEELADLISGNANLLLTARGEYFVILKVK